MPEVRALAAWLGCGACGRREVVSLLPDARHVTAWMRAHVSPRVLAVQLEVEGSGVEWWQAVNDRRAT